MSEKAESFEMACLAFELMTLAEKQLVLEQFARLRYPLVVDRFHESVYRVIVKERVL